MMRKQKGVALVIVLYIMIVFVIIGLLLVSIMAVESNMAHQIHLSTQALYIAEAGVEYALLELNSDTDWTDGTPANVTNVALNPDTSGNTGSFSINYASTAAQQTTLTTVGKAISSGITLWRNIAGLRRIKQDITGY